jgi:hypothetical protein
MTNEAICYETPTRFARYTVSSAAAIPKGSVLKLTSPNSATLYDGFIGTAAVGGIAWMEKVASPTDGSTEIVAALNGTFGMVASAAVTVGYDVICSKNKVRNYATLSDEKGYVIGKSLESCGTAATVVKIRVDVL